MDLSNRQPARQVRHGRRTATYHVLPVLACAALLTFGGCSSAPRTTHTGFLSDYSSLKEVNAQKMNYASPEIRDYRSFMVDPVQIKSQQGELSAKDRAEIASYFRDSFAGVLRDRGYTITQTPGPGTARVRLALTNVHESTWWMKIHPASNLSGAGRGGAAMEGEVVDSVTGKQVAAVVQSGVGSQFTAFNFSTVSDIKSTIDEWAKNAGARLDELRNEGKFAK
jgi:hypothetical protein